MKKSMFFFLIILSLSFASAVKYECLNGVLNKDIDEIEKYSVKTVEGISIGVTYSDFAGGLKRIAADLLIDAKRISLANETNGTSIELKSGDYTLELVSVTDLVKIKVGGSTDEIEVGETEKVSDLHVYVIEASQNPSEAEVIAGIEKVSLEVNSVPLELIDIDDEEYLVELVSASDDNTLVKVSRCRNGNFTILVEPEINITVNNTQDANETINSTTTNVTQTNITISNPTNSSINTTQPECLSGSIKENKFCSAAGKYETLRTTNQACSQNYECESENCGEVCKKSGLLKRFFNWLNNLLS